ncbi:undecaprenyldiphospho-muramoylpentapeptide beta-N-acetylglucosaminyltransferase [Oscillospiraceae bacterium HV4-5-C5C]|nr:undecaprenyldiphospho-muramoylpentapeptide beta-N-acetylglucosaminyltransferase [Oscillospiraceae bacterium HV4-5-C5C]
MNKPVDNAIPKDCEYDNRGSRPLIMLTGGGTSGHINPALAVAAALRAARPDCKLLYVGTSHGLEHELVPKAGLPFIAIPASPFKRSSPKAWVKAARDLQQGYSQSLRLLRRLRPQALLGTGGYVSDPLLLAAGHLGIPYVIHEQNAFPGQSNRLLARRAQTVCLSYEAARPHFKQTARIVTTGNPVNPLFFQLRREQARQRLKLDPDQLIVLVSGGSLGARTLNQGTLAYLKEHPEGPACFFLVTGRRLARETQETAGALRLGPSRLQLFEFLYNMPDYMAAADLYISRAGAGTCAEIAALGLPSLMVPYPYATGDHQMHNAQAFAEAGAALVCPDADFTPAYLNRQLGLLLQDAKQRRDLGDKARQFACPQAAQDIAATLLNLLDQSVPGRPGYEK